MEKYPKVKVGDRVVVFTYWNTTPSDRGTVTAQTDHFVEICGEDLFKSRRWVSKDNIEIVHA